MIPRKIICPYCFHSFRSNEIMWRCHSHYCHKYERCEEDHQYKQYHPSEDLKQPHILKKTRVRNGFAECENCHTQTNIRICPICHSMLPDTQENIIISIIGAPGSGKSYYVGTLLNKLNQHLYMFGCSFSYTTTKDEELYKTKFEDYFKNGRKLDKTQQPSDEANFIGANVPILCNIRDTRLTDRTFTFFDAAGENFDNPVTMNAIAEYLQHSTALLLLLDPLQIETVKNALKAENPTANVRENEEITSYADILENIMNVLRLQLRIPKKRKIDIPIAVAFSKWDLIQNCAELCPENSMIVNDSPHFRDGFSNEDCDNVSLEVESLLSQWGYGNFILTLKQNFSTYKFFGISAIGSEPDATGKMPKIISKRVEDPFLWLLHKKRIII